MVFVNFYLEDFPNFNGLPAGLDLWYNFWGEIKYKNDLPDSIYIYLVLKLLGTLPVTTCECERSFSSLRSIKTWDRSTMTNGRLNGLVLLFIHREIDLTVSEIIGSFRISAQKLSAK